MSKPNRAYTKILQEVDKYYTERVKAHGPTHWGVDWNSEASQNLRFDQLLKVTKGEKDCSVIDYGCGYGAMASYMRTLGYTVQYQGYDISQEMIKAASIQQSDISNCIFVSDAAMLNISDYTIASGVFNVKQEVPGDRWLSYILDTIANMAKYSRKGFSFNMLTSYSDKEKMRDNLFYGDPSFFMDHCIRNYSKSVAILHGFGLYEFTVLVDLK
jgi:SAM-dependent methyltransferase